MQILVTGSNGQLGNELQKIAASDMKHSWYFTDVHELDITQKDAVEGYFVAHGIDICINCAAYTAVDKAEEEVALAMLINTEAVKNLADACLENKALLIHISTDYVFNGENFKPYEEGDPINGLSVYGKSKAHGEQVLVKHECNSVIIRTSWLYAANGKNFVKTMLRLGAERESLTVVADQVGTPTWAFDLAWAIMLVADKWNREQIKEIYHFSNEGAISWYDFAKAIMELGNLKCTVKAIPSSAYPVKTKRPFYSVLSKEKFKNTYQVSVPYWKDSLMNCLKEIHG